jgi:pimeloyl-ACP methyl ester carboxylesterase
VGRLPLAGGLSPGRGESGNCGTKIKRILKRCFFDILFAMRLFRAPNLLSHQRLLRPALLLAVSALVIAGCGASATRPVNQTTVFEVGSPTQSVPQPAAIAATQPVYLMHLPGIGGTRIIDQDMLNGLRAGGFKGKCQICDWSGDNPGFTALEAEASNKAKAAEYAKQLTAKFDADPSAQIFLTSHSGGGGLAVWVLEALPPRVKVQTVILMSPALSPTYDLTKALEHVNGKMYVFSSVGDAAVLGYGCRMFGTMDGVKCDAAGRVGFVRPASADPIQYQKLVSMPYQQDWRKFYDYGDHIGGMTLDFGRSILAPLMLHPSAVPGTTTAPVVR